MSQFASLHPACFIALPKFTDILLPPHWLISSIPLHKVCSQFPFPQAQSFHAQF